MKGRALSWRLEYNKYCKKWLPALKFQLINMCTTYISHTLNLTLFDRTQYTASAGAATGAAYPPPSPYGTQQQATGQPYGTPTSDPYVIAGYTRPAGPGQQQQQQQQGYYNQAQAASYAASMGAVANKIARPTPPSTVYPTYSANTTGTTASASYAGFAPPQQHQPTQSNKCMCNFVKIQSFLNIAL